MHCGRLLRALASTVAVAGLTLAGQSVALAAPVEGPPTVTAADIRFARPPQTLRYGTAQQAGLVPRYIDQIAVDIARFTRPSPTYPMFPGAVALAAHDGTIVAHDVVGF